VSGDVLGSGVAGDSGILGADATALPSTSADIGGGSFGSGLGASGGGVDAGSFGAGAPDLSGVTSDPFAGQFADPNAGFGPGANAANAASSNLSSVASDPFAGSELPATSTPAVDAGGIQQGLGLDQQIANFQAANPLDSGQGLPTQGLLGQEAQTPVITPQGQGAGFDFFPGSDVVSGNFPLAGTSPAQFTVGADLPASIDPSVSLGQGFQGTNFSNLASGLPTTSDVVPPVTSGLSAPPGLLDAPPTPPVASDPGLLPNVPPPASTPAGSLTADVGNATIPASASAPATAASPVAAAGGASSNAFLASLGLTPTSAGLLGLGAAGLGYGVYKANQPLPDQAQLQQIAQQLASNSAASQAQAQQLIDPLISGNLPPGQAAQVQQALQDSITATKARYASMGMSGSSAETDQIAYLIGKSVSLAGSLEQQMANAGISLSSQAANDLNVESTLFQSLMNATINQDNALASAIAGFAGQAALATAIGNKSVTVKA
jgi:hypothetical protein